MSVTAKRKRGFSSRPRVFVVVASCTSCGYLTANLGRRCTPCLNRYERNLRLFKGESNGLRGEVKQGP